MEILSFLAMDSRGIEPRTTPMLREYYTTKPQARVLEIICPYEATCCMHCISELARSEDTRVLNWVEWSLGRSTLNRILSNSLEPRQGDSESCLLSSI